MAAAQAQGGPAGQGGGAPDTLERGRRKGHYVVWLVSAGRRRGKGEASRWKNGGREGEGLRQGA